MLDRIARRGDAATAAEALHGLDLREALHFAWRQWRIIAGATAIALLVATIWIARQTPIYMASVQLLLEPSRERGVGEPMSWDWMMEQSYVENQMAIIRSTALARRVVEKERLAEGEAPPVAPRRGWWEAFTGLFAAAPAAVPPAPPPASSNETPAFQAAVENLKGAIAVQRAGQSQVVTVTFADPDPQRAARLANAVADAFVVDKLDTRYEAARRASHWLSDRLVELRQKLRESEEAVVRFRADNALEQSAPGATLTQEQLGQINQRLVAARADVAERRARYELLQKIENGGGALSALPEAVASTAVAELRRQENEASRQEADLLARYSDRHPSVVNIRAQLADIRRSIGVEMRRLAANIRNEYDLSRSRLEALEKTLQEASGQVGLDSAKAITLRELERNAAVNKTLFEEFLQRSRVTQEQSTFQNREARVITPALAPTQPSAPRKLNAMFAALSIGLVAGIGAAFAREKLNAGFSTPRQIEEQLGLPLLASVSKMSTADLSVDGKTLRMPEFVLQRPLSRFSEAIRSLRSSIQMSDVDDPPRLLQVTSTLPSEGKTMIVLASAASAAHGGLRTLVVDGDLRHPSATRYFDAQEGPGLVDYLAGDAELEKAIRLHEASGVWVLPAGAQTQNPPGMLGSERMKQLLSALRERFDFVIVDTPPVGPVVDALIIAQIVDKVIYVVRWGATPREMVAHTLSRLPQRKISGVVLNHVVDRNARRYGRDGHAYYYGARYYRNYYDS